MNRLKYNNKITSEDLITRYQYGNTYEVPNLERIVVSLSLKSSGFNRKNLPKLLMASTIITGQKTKPVITKQGDAAFGIRKNDPVATKVTLRGDKMYVIEDDQPRGFMTIVFKDNRYVIDLIAISSEYRGKGLAKKLIEKGLNKYTKTSIVEVKMHVGTQEKNTRAINLYSGLGFELEGTDMIYHLHRKIE